MAKKNNHVATSRSEVARHFGVSDRTVGTWLGAGCPGSMGHYDLALIEEWRKPRAKREPVNRSRDFWEKRLKKEKAKMAHLERLRQEGELVDRQVIRTFCEILARRLRQAGASLQKMFGPIAAKIVNEAVEDIERELASVIPNDDRDNVRERPT